MGRRQDGTVTGRGLRFVMLHEIRRRRVMTVAELVDTLNAEGYELGGRASKVVSDALRWEVARGRVIRRARGSGLQVVAQRARTWLVSGNPSGCYERHCRYNASSTTTTDPSSHSGPADLATNIVVCRRPVPSAVGKPLLALGPLAE